MIPTILLALAASAPVPSEPTPTSVEPTTTVVTTVAPTTAAPVQVPVVTIVDRHPEWPARDDGPCPQGMTAELPEGAQYDGATGLWTDANGGTLGYGIEEDSCIRVVIDDLAPATGTTVTVYVAGRQTLPVTL